jgi:hypothetical protein
MDMLRTLAGLVLALLSATAAAADKRVPLPGGESMIIGWNAAWVVAEPENVDPIGTVRFNGGDRVLWEVSIAPMPPHPSLTADTGNLRIYVRSMVRMLEQGNVIVDHEQRTLEGVSKGFYVKGHDVKAAALQQGKAASANAVAAKGKPKAPDYANGYFGALSVSGRAYVFEVLWNTGGEKGAEAALAAMRTLRIQ